MNSDTKGLTMTLRVIIPALCLALATMAWAKSVEAPRKADQTASAEDAKGPPVPISWIPGWLMEPIERAIADANDPHERKPKR